TSTRARIHSPAASSASFSSTGLSCLQGWHQSAHRSTITGVVLDRSTTSSLNVSSVTSITNADAGAAAEAPSPALAVAAARAACCLRCAAACRALRSTAPYMEKSRGDCILLSCIKTWRDRDQCSPVRDCYRPGGRPPVPPDVCAGRPDRKNRDLIRPARTDKSCVVAQKPHHVGACPHGRELRGRSKPPACRACPHGRELRGHLKPPACRGCPHGRELRGRSKPPACRGCPHGRELRGRSKPPACRGCPHR